MKNQGETVRTRVSGRMSRGEAFSLTYRVPGWASESRREEVSAIVERAAKECVRALGGDERALRVVYVGEGMECTGAQGVSQ